MVVWWVAACAVGVTLLASAAIGLRAARSGSDDLEDYTIARSSQSATSLALSFVASGLGAWLLFAVPEVGAGVGLVAVVGYALAAAAPFVVLAWLGPRLRAVLPRGHGLNEFVRLRFGTGFHRYVVGVSLLYMLVFVTAELTAVGAVTTTLSDLDPRAVILAVAVATVAYTGYGGLRASLVTDRWQAVAVVVLLAVAAVAAAAALPTAPGAALAASGLLGVHRVGVESALTLVLAVTAANLFHHGYWQRVWAARDSGTLQRGALVGAAASIPLVLGVGLFGVAAVGAGLDLGTPPAPFFAVLGGLPAVLGAAVLVLAVALVASTVDTLENGLAALVVTERPSLSLAAARLVTVLAMVPAVAVALQGLSVLRLLLVADLLAATAVVPALLGLWRRATPAGALAGAVAGLVGAVVPTTVAAGSPLAGLQAVTFPDGVPTLAPFAGAIIASTVVAVATCLAGRSVTDLAALDEQVPVLRGAMPQPPA